MLDSPGETDDVVEVRRRCRSFDALPRDGSDILLWFADDSGGATGRQRPSDRQQVPAGGSDEAGRCLSASDLLTAGDAQPGDDYDPSWCSVNNLETDCVSPRVSSNSLFSQLDAGTAASSDDVGDHPLPSSSHHLTAADVATATAAGDRRTPSGFGDDQPMYTRHWRRIPPPTAAMLQGRGPPHPITTFLLRQLTTAAGDGALRPYCERRSSVAAAARSASCPSLVYDHRHTGHQQAQLACRTSTQTAEHGVNGGGEHTGRDQLRAALDEALAPASIIAHSTGCGARAPMVWLTARPSRSTSPPTSSAPDTATSGGRRQVDDGGRKSRHRGVGSSSAMTTGRATQRLARTKCLQWLNSFDEDD